MKTEQQNVNNTVASDRGKRTDQLRQIKRIARLLDGDTPATIEQSILLYNGEFDPGSGRTLAACLIHASRAEVEELALQL